MGPLAIVVRVTELARGEYGILRPPFIMVARVIGKRQCQGPDMQARPRFDVHFQVGAPCLELVCTAVPLLMRHGTLPVGLPSDRPPQHAFGASPRVNYDARGGRRACCATGEPCSLRPPTVTGHIVTAVRVPGDHALRFMGDELRTACLIK